MKDVYVRLDPDGTAVITERHRFESEVYLTAMNRYEQAFARLAEQLIGTSVYGSLALLGARRANATEDETEKGE
jgi:hypothetical protein